MFMNMITDYSGKLVTDYHSFHEFLSNHKRNENYFLFIGHLLQLKKKIKNMNEIDKILI